MDEYAYVNGKKLRKGFTTGTCATAATAAAISMILNQDIEEKVTVSTANGVEVTMEIKDPSFGELTASAAVEKDGGHGLGEIALRVKMLVTRRRTERPRDLYYSLVLVFAWTCVG